MPLCRLNKEAPAVGAKQWSTLRPLRPARTAGKRAEKGRKLQGQRACAKRCDSRALPDYRRRGDLLSWVTRSWSALETCARGQCRPVRPRPGPAVLCQRVTHGDRRRFAGCPWRPRVHQVRAQRGRERGRVCLRKSQVHAMRRVRADREKAGKPAKECKDVFPMPYLFAGARWMHAISWGVCYQGTCLTFQTCLGVCRGTYEAVHLRV
jgi:hypothetical protein